MTLSNKPNWPQLYLIGAAGGIGLVADAMVKIPKPANQWVMFGGVAVLFSLLGRWVSKNAWALSAIDDEPPAQESDTANAVNIQTISAPEPSCTDAINTLTTPPRSSNGQTPILKGNVK